MRYNITFICHDRTIGDYACYRYTYHAADYYCKSNKLQICCPHGSDYCKLLDYPSELTYSMGEYFELSMAIVIVLCLFPFIAPFGIPTMLYHDCRNKKYNRKRQRYFDILCLTCFVISALNASWTTYEYYRYPYNRCSENSDLFGISTSDNGSNSLYEENIWVMSGTTYCSLFCFISLCLFSVCSGVIFIVHLNKKNAPMIPQDDNEQVIIDNDM